MTDQNKPDWQRPVGIDITMKVLKRMEGMMTPEQRRIFRDPIKRTTEKALWEASDLLVIASGQEALAEYDRGGERGIALCDQAGHLNIKYIPQVDCRLALFRITEVQRAEIAKMIEKYDPDKEAVVVIVAIAGAQAAYVSRRGTVKAQALHVVDQFPYTLPKDVTMKKEDLPNGRRYLFYEKRLGTLGTMTLIEAVNNQTQINVEVSGPSGDALFNLRRATLLPITEELTRRLYQGLGID